MNKNCTCEIDVDLAPCDLPEEYHSYFVKAHKELNCYECKDKIKVGDEYRLTLMRDGKWTRVNTCLDCYSIENNLFCDTMHGCLYDLLWEHLDQCDEDSMPIACLPYLTPKAREFVCNAIEKAWEEIDELNAEYDND